MKQIKTYEQSVKKRYIQNLCLSQIAGLKCSVLALSGPNCDDYCELLTKYITTTNKEKIYSFEKDMQVYHSQLVKSYSNKKLRDKVIFRCGDIANAEPQQFCDLDFCVTLKSVEDTIAKLFHKQAAKYKDEIKVFMFTVSYLRVANALEKLLAFLQMLLRTIIKNKYTIQMEYGKQHYIYTTNSRYIVKVFSYDDTSPLFIVQIIYK